MELPDLKFFMGVASGRAWRGGTEVFPPSRPSLQLFGSFAGKEATGLTRPQFGVEPAAGN